MRVESWRIYHRLPSATNRFLGHVAHIDTVFTGSLGSWFRRGRPGAIRGVQQHETHLSAQSPSTSPDSRISCPDEYKKRPHRSQAPSREGPQASDGQHPLTRMSARFPSTARLRTRPEFTAVQDGGRRVSTKYMTLLAQPNAGPCDRLGLIASRRLGGAVIRNRAKRRLREIFRRQEPAGSRSSNMRALDLVVIPRRELVSAPFALLEQDFQSAVRRLRARA